jgi:hypothetical protein
VCSFANLIADLERFFSGETCQHRKSFFDPTTPNTLNTGFSKIPNMVGLSESNQQYQTLRIPVVLLLLCAHSFRLPFTREEEGEEWWLELKD